MNNELLWREETPYSTRFNDVYYSIEGGSDEARQVYLAGIGLDDLAESSEHPVRVGELGFGTGLNFLVTAKAWRQKAAERVLHYVAIEKYPLGRDALQRAHAQFPEILDESRRLLYLLPPTLSGEHRLWFAPNIVLDLWHGDALNVLSELNGDFVGWYMDGFAPKTNPAMFSLALCQQMERLSAPGARVASFSVARVVRQHLSEAGFSVVKSPGFGRKKHVLRATKYSQKGQPSIKKYAKNRKIAILGGGIAGACCAEQLRRLGFTPTVFIHPGANTASQVPVAAVAPRFSADKTSRGQQIALCYHEAIQWYENYPEVVFHRGALKMPSQGFSIKRLTAACDTWHDLDDHAPRMIKAGQYLPTAVMIRPQRLIDLLLESITQRQAEILGYHHNGADWCLEERGGSVHDGFAQLILACGTALPKFLPQWAKHMHIKSSQITYYETQAPPRLALGGRGGHVVPDGKGFWLGQSHIEHDNTPQHTRWGLDPAAESTGQWAGDKLSLTGHWPLCGAVPKQEGLFVLAGSGGHGFTLSPRLAAQVAFMVSGYHVRHCSINPRAQ